MGFTVEQQTAIDSKGKVIVSASAGSGKTTVMIEKIIQLILGDTAVSDILAVTFTKKAASQMKDKLKRELIKAINTADVFLLAIITLLITKPLICNLKMVQQQILQLAV